MRSGGREDGQAAAGRLCGPRGGVSTCPVCDRALGAPRLERQGGTHTLTPAVRGLCAPPGLPLQPHRHRGTQASFPCPTLTSVPQAAHQADRGWRGVDSAVHGPLGLLWLVETLASPQRVPELTTGPKASLPRGSESPRRVVTPPGARRASRDGGCSLWTWKRGRSWPEWVR